MLAVVLSIAVAVMHTRAAPHTGPAMADTPVTVTSLVTATPLHNAGAAMAPVGPADQVGVGEGPDSSRHLPLGCGTHDAVCAAIANHLPTAAAPTSAVTTDPAVDLATAAFTCAPLMLRPGGPPGQRQALLQVWRC